MEKKTTKKAKETVKETPKEVSLQAQLVNAKGDKVGTVDLKEAVFGVKPSREFLHEYVTVYETNQRQGTAHTKTRSEVSGGGHKPWKQKHTGRARAGSTRSPLWRHGGITFGPRQGRSAAVMPRQKARLALAQALSAKNASGSVVFVDQLSVAEPKTKLVAGLLKALKCGPRTLLVTESRDEKLSLAGRNIPSLQLMLAGDLNAYAVLRCTTLVVTRPALEKLGARWS